MNEFTTVFEVASDVNGIRTDALLRFAIGAAALGVGLRGFIKYKRAQERSLRKLIEPFVITAWSMIWLTGHFPLFKTATSEIGDLIEIHKSGKCQIVEGIVHVTHQQPYQGHSSGDLISIGDQKFEVNYFHVSPGYNQSISHGGALRGGVYARLHYYDKLILKVEVATKKGG